MAFEVELPEAKKQPTEIQTVMTVEQPSPHVSTEVVTEKVDLTLQQRPLKQDEISIDITATDKLPTELQAVMFFEEPSPHVSTEIVTEQVDLTPQQVPLTQDEISVVVKGI